MTVVKAARALVVDDNIDAAFILGLVLEQHGFAVAIEHDSLGALTRTLAEQFDIFVLDIGLPDVDGHELARQLLTRPECKKSLFVALTGYGTQEDKQKSRAAGFHHHFVKPANLPALLDVLTSHRC
jgi:CheY-like chemotaxis protein